MKYFKFILHCTFLLMGINVQAQLYIAPGTEVHAFSTAYLVNTSLDNQGTLIVDDHLQFLGDLNSTIAVNNSGILNASSIGFAGSNDFESQGDITASILMEDTATLNLQNGFWDIDAIYYESNTRSITGNDGTNLHILRNAGSSSSFGNIGFELMSADQPLGATEVYRRYGNLDINGNPSLLRYYEIASTNNTDVNATANFLFYEHDLNGLDKNKLVMYRSEDGITNWQEVGGTLTTGDPNKIEVSGLSSISGFWAFAESGSTFSTEDTAMQNIGLYPNPASKNVYFNIPKSVVLESIRITDVSGKVINYKIDGHMHLNVENLSDGLYILTFKTAVGHSSRKLVIMH